MMKVTVDIHKDKNNKVTYYAPNGYDMHDKVFDALYCNGIEEEKAIDCASWCELAVDGETYNEEEFDVYVEFED